MSEKVSIFNLTYGQLNEIDRSQSARDASYEKGSTEYESRIPRGVEFNSEEVYIKASDLAMEQAEYDANQAGYENIDDYAMDQEIYGLSVKNTPDGEKYSPGEQLIDMLRDNFENMIMNGEIDL